MRASVRIVRRDVPAHEHAEGLHPVLKRVLAARGVTSGDAFDTSLGGLHPVGQLGGMDAAVDLLVEAISNDRSILIVADFDADGATSCALAIRALHGLGAKRVDYLVPNRFEYGYGLTPEIVAVAAEQEPDLLITVDNGISSVDGVAAARAAGIAVLVTDHHLAGKELPAANAIVNPNLPGDPFPSKCLAGVGVIFYVMLALRARLRGMGWFEAPRKVEPNLAQLLDLVALGTVADVVPLDQNNRRMVAQGLKRIRSGVCQPGITALIEVAGRSRNRIAASDLAFALGPRLNAAGRLSDMSLGIECLLGDEPTRCRGIAAQLDELNRQRRALEREMQDQAIEIIESIDTLPDGTQQHAICLYDSSWHQGVVGVVASRIKDRYHRPVIAFAAAGEGELKGSGRSVAGVHIRDMLDAVATRCPGLLSRFGGHAMAAGLSIREEDFDEFRAAFGDEVGRLGLDIDGRTICTDGELSAADFSLSLAREIATVAPWGQGFPEPQFDGVFEIKAKRVVSEAHVKLKLRVGSPAIEIDAIAFNQADTDWAGDAAVIRAVYRLSENEYLGSSSLQLIVEYAEGVDLVRNAG